MDKCLDWYDDSKKALISDTFSGCFSLTCGEMDIPVWDTEEVLPFGTVSVLYTNGCADALIVTITDSAGNIDTFVVPPRNTRSRTFSNLVSVRVSCPGTGSGICEGRYCINLHYFI